jgi:hypothetical protein
MRKFIFASFLAVMFMLLSPTWLYAGGSAGARAALARSLPDAKFTNVPLSDALEFLRDVSGANIVVDWKSLEAVNVGKDTQINVNVKWVKLSKVLSLVLNEAGPGGTLTYFLDDNVIEITTVATADKKLITVVYYVDDILEMNTPFDPTINIGGGSMTNGNSSTVGQGTTGLGVNGGSSNSGSGGGGGLFGNNNNSSTSNGATAAADKLQRSKDLVTMIQKLIRPEVWKDNGGTSAIEYFNGNLIVTAPRSVQEAIGGPVD